MHLFLHSHFHPTPPLKLEATDLLPSPNTRENSPFEPTDSGLELAF